MVNGDQPETAGWNVFLTSAGLNIHDGRWAKGPAGLGCAHQMFVGGSASPIIHPLVTFAYIYIYILYCLYERTRDRPSPYKRISNDAICRTHWPNRDPSLEPLKMNRILEIVRAAGRNRLTVYS